jgi:WD40 repeat protein
MGPNDTSSFNNEKKLLARQKTTIIKVFWSEVLNAAISISLDGRVLLWSMDGDSSQFSPTSEILIENEISSARFLDLLSRLTLCLQNSVIIYNLKSLKEDIRLTHNLTLKDAILVQSHGIDGGLTLYTWDIENTLTAWKILGSSSTFFTYSTEPLYVLHCTIFPENCFNESGSCMSTFNFTKALDVNSRTGQCLSQFETRCREAIVDGCRAITSSGTPAILFATRTTLFLGSECISYSGSLGDSIEIEKCSQFLAEELIAYSGVEWDSSGIPSLTSGKMQFTGILVVISHGKALNRRICALRHTNARILQWEIFQNYAITVASDNMVRVWDIYQIQDNVPGKMLCSFPIEYKATSIAISSGDKLIIFIGDESGDFTALQVIEPPPVS